MSVLRFVISHCKNEAVATGQNKPHRLLNGLIYITAKKLYPWLQTVLIMCTIGQIRAKYYCVFECSSWKFFNSMICSLMCSKFVFQMLMSLSHCKDTQGKCLSFQVDILKDEVLICGFYGIPLRDHWQNWKLNTECPAINLLPTRCLPSFPRHFYLVV